MLNLAWVLLEALLLQGLVFLAMAFREKFGPFLVFVLAVSSYFIANISASLVAQRFFAWEISLGSTATFVLVLFLILFFYDLEGIKGARRYFQVIILGGFFQIILTLLFYFRLSYFPFTNLVFPDLRLDKIFLLVSKTTLFSLIAFVIDGFFLILLYNYLSLKFPICPRELSVFISLLFILWLDSLIFVLTNFYSSPEVFKILIGHLLAKSLLAVCFSFFYFVLKRMYGLKKGVDRLIDRLPLAY